MVRSSFGRRRSERPARSGGLRICGYPLLGTSATRQISGRRCAATSRRFVVAPGGEAFSIPEQDRPEGPPAQLQVAPPTNGHARPATSGQTIREALEESKRQQILAALEKANWVVAGPEGAAARVGMKRSTLQFRMQKLGIRVSRTGA
jgi:transcriptional regulator with GAF, ATPase, and Fis domain